MDKIYVLFFTNIFGMYYEIYQARIKVALKNAIRKKGFTMKQFVIEELNMSMNGYYYSLKTGSIKLKTIIKICEILEIHPASLFLHEEDIYSWNNLLDKYVDCTAENKQLKEKIINLNG